MKIWRNLARYVTHTYRACSAYHFNNWLLVDVLVSIAIVVIFLKPAITKETYRNQYLIMINHTTAFF